MEHQTGKAPDQPPFKDCFARSCRHHDKGQCGIYKTTRPPTITVDGRCLGYDLGGR